MFLILFLGNTVTTSMVIPQKLKKDNQFIPWGNKSQITSPNKVKVKIASVVKIKVKKEIE